MRLSYFIVYMTSNISANESHILSLNEFRNECDNIPVNDSVSITPHELQLKDLPYDILNHIISYLDDQNIYKLVVINFRKYCGDNPALESDEESESDNTNYRHSLDIPIDRHVFWVNSVRKLRIFLRKILGITLVKKIRIQHNKYYYISKAYKAHCRTYKFNDSYEYMEGYCRKHKLTNITDIVYSDVEYSSSSNKQYASIVANILNIMRNMYGKKPNSNLLLIEIYMSIFIDIHEYSSYKCIKDAKTYTDMFDLISESLYLFWERNNKVIIPQTEYLLSDPYINPYAELHRKDKYYINYQNNSRICNINYIYKFIYCMIYAAPTDPKHIIARQAYIHIRNSIVNILQRLYILIIYIDKIYEEIPTEYVEYYKIYKKHVPVFCHYDQVIKNMRVIIDELKHQRVQGGRLAVRQPEDRAKQICSNINREKILEELFEDIDLKSPYIKKRDVLVYNYIKKLLTITPPTYSLPRLASP